MSGEGSGPAFGEISREECLELLASQSVGRVAVADFGAAPLVVPVNFVLDGDDVVFRTDYGGKFHLAVVDQQPMSFEVDGVDTARRRGWSVLVRGRAAEVTEGDRDRLSLHPWAPGHKSHWVRVRAEAVSGRRIEVAPAGEERGER